MSILILNSGVRSPSPPANEIILDDFESGDLDPRWTHFGSEVSVNTWAGFGIDAPPNGGAYGASAPVSSGNGLLVENIPDMVDVWVKAYFRAGSAGATPISVLELVNAVGGHIICALLVYLASARFILDGGDTYTGTKSYADNEWVQGKFHVKMHQTEGQLQYWWWDGSAWVLDIDASGIDTTIRDDTVDTVRAYSVEASDYITYFDSFGIWDGDPDA